MRWLKEQGVSTNLWEYMDLPERVLDDCRLLMAAEVRRRQILEAR